LKELTVVVVAIAMTFGARAVMEFAWYRYRSRAKPKARVGWGPDSIGLPRPMFLGVTAGLVFAAAALVAVVGVQFGIGEVLLDIFLALCAVVLITTYTALAVMWFKWVARRY
jgi:hypothetical protein